MKPFQPEPLMVLTGIFVANNGKLFVNSVLWPEWEGSVSPTIMVLASPSSTS